MLNKNLSYFCTFRWAFFLSFTPFSLFLSLPLSLSLSLSLYAFLFYLTLPVLPQHRTQDFSVRKIALVRQVLPREALVFNP